MKNDKKYNGVSVIKRKYTDKSGNVHEYAYNKVTISKSCPTFYGYAKKFLESRRDIKPITKGKLLGVLEKHIRPQFEFVPVSEIRKDTIRDFLNTCMVQRKEIKTIFNTTFDELVDNDLVDKNYARLIRKPKFDQNGNRIESKKRELPSMGQLNSFYRATLQSQNKYTYVVILMLTTGLGRGEALGILKSDINFNECSINITKSWNKDEKGKCYIGELKNRYRKRKVWFPKEIIPILQEGIKKSHGDYFATGKKNVPIYPDTFSARYFRGVARKLSIDVPFSSHCARHIYITQAINAGVPPTEIMRQVGHKDLTMICEVYTHYIRDEHPSDIMEKYMSDMSQELLSKRTEKSTSQGSIIHVDFRSKIS